jgi:hypothetical protein
LPLPAKLVTGLAGLYGQFVRGENKKACAGEVIPAYAFAYLFDFDLFA